MKSGLGVEIDRVCHAPPVICASKRKMTALVGVEELRMNSVRGSISGIGNGLCISIGHSEPQGLRRTILLEVGEDEVREVEEFSGKQRGCWYLLFRRHGGYLVVSCIAFSRRSGDFAVRWESSIFKNGSFSCGPRHRHFPRQLRRRRLGWGSAQRCAIAS